VEIKATIKHKENFAEYRIRHEKQGIYQATLEKYDGDVHDMPPRAIILTKGVRHWIGSCAEQNLIDSLGEILDINRKSKTSFFSGESGELL
jgi:hypothetical protein